MVSGDQQSSSIGRTNLKRRRRRPFISRKKARTKSQVEEGVPTDEEWKCMTAIGSFIVDVFEECASSDDVDDADDSDSGSVMSTSSGCRLRMRKVVFHKGDDAVLHSPMNNTDDVWLGRIGQIRKRPHEEDVWVKVYWYWCGSDLCEIIRSFKATDIAPLERVSSDFYDYVSARSFIVTHVHEYEENDLDQLEIESGDFFNRAFLHHRRHIIEPKPGSETCICKHRYIPYPPSILDTQLPLRNNEEMHFCPRKFCRQWYHTACLMNYDFVDSPSEWYYGDRAVRLLANDPDSEVPCALLGWFSKAHSDKDPDKNDFCESPRSPTALPPERPSPTLASLQAVFDSMMLPYSTLAHLPPALVRIAQCPIVRRPGPARDGWTAVGNAQEVVLARRFVYAAFDGLHPEGALSQRLTWFLQKVEATMNGETGVPEDEDAMELDGEDQTAASADHDREMEILSSVCAELADYQLLASPYLPYWERREHELEGETWMHGPPLVCPGCKGAI